MNIIQAGELKDEEKYHGECKRCGAIVECDESEIINSNFEILNSSLNKIPYVKCPTNNCGINILLEKGKWKKEFGDEKFKQKEWYITPTVPDKPKSILHG